MDNIDKYIKYKTKYLQLVSILKGCHENNMIGGGKINFLIIGNIRGNDLEFIPELKKTLKSLNGNVKEYKFKFKNKPFILDDLTFESVSNHIKLFIDRKKLSDCIIICLEESSPYGLFFADMYPEMCKAIICYPLRLNTKESLDRLYHKYVKKNGWKYISNNYDPIDYFFEINDKRLNELFDKNEITSERSASKKLWLGDFVPLTKDHSSVLAEEEKNIIDLLINLQLRKQYDKIPKVYKIPTYLFSRLDMDSVSTIKLNFERKDIADMKGILSTDDAIYNSMMWNIARVQYDRELMELNKENNYLRIHYTIAFENNEDTRLITDAVQILISE
jgi:hypothetical protein